MQTKRVLMHKHQLDYIHELTLWVTPGGELVARPGNMRVVISQEEARGLLDDALSRTRQSEKPDSSKNRKPGP